MSLTISVDYIENGIVKHSTVDDVVQCDHVKDVSGRYTVVMHRWSKVSVAFDNVTSIRMFNEHGHLIETITYQAIKETIINSDDRTKMTKLNHGAVMDLDSYRTLDKLNDGGNLISDMNGHAMLFESEAKIPSWDTLRYRNVESMIILNESTADQTPFSENSIYCPESWLERYPMDVRLAIIFKEIHRDNGSDADHPIPVFYIADRPNNV